MSRSRVPGPPAGAVVVGVDLDGSPAALAFAADEAVRTHHSIHLVHVVRVSGAEAYAGVLSAAYDAADATVKHAARRARELVAERVPVTVEQLDEGGVVDNLADRASRGSMLVLEHRRLGRLRRFVTGSVVAGTATRCPVPLVAVPQGWRRSAPEPVVTVGVQDVEETRALVRRGLLEAKARGGRVEVVHAWSLQGGYDAVVSDQDFVAEQEDRLSRALLPCIELACQEDPDIRVRVRVMHSEPTAALLARAATSQLLVIGRRHHRLPLGSHLGPVARTVLQHSTAPVLLEPESPRD